MEWWRGQLIFRILSNKSAGFAHQSTVQQCVELLSNGENSGQISFGLHGGAETDHFHAFVGCHCAYLENRTIIGGKNGNTGAPICARISFKDY